jgi:rhodanese-related sulfurtransferase
MIKKLFKKLNPNLSVEDARKLIKDGATLIDVRSESEFASGHAANAINIPLGSLQSAIATLPKTVLVLHCQSGGRSMMAMNMIKKSGRTDVYNLGGLSKAMQL